MRYIAPLLFLVIVTAGCDPIKELDWDRTSKSQRLRVGNQVKVEGVTYGLSLYEFKGFTDPDKVWVKKNWGTELDLWAYNSNDPTRETNSIAPINPNAPIGTVIYTVYNPMHHPALAELRDMYPDAIKKGEYPTFQHKFEIVGRIHSFKRDIVPSADETQPDISLTAVRIHVENLKHIESINIKK